jgi:hypothetical protein
LMRRSGRSPGTKSIDRNRMSPSIGDLLKVNCGRNFLIA